MLPLGPASFIGSSAEAAKSCFRGAIAAFGPGEFHRVFGRGSKILLPWRDCCLWARQVSSSLRQRQQNPTPEARLLPLVMASFFRSSAEAAKSCFRGAIAAFGPGEFLRVFGGGSKILLLRRDCCLWARRVSSGRRRRQQNPAPEARLLPLVRASFFGSTAEAAKSYFRGAIAAFAPGGFQGTSGRSSKILLLRRGCCLCAWWVSSRAVNKRRTEQR